MRCYECSYRIDNPNWRARNKTKTSIRWDKLVSSYRSEDDLFADFRRPGRSKAQPVMETKRNGREVDERTKQYVLRLYDDCLPTAQIAKEVELSVDRVRTILRHEGKDTGNYRVRHKIKEYEDILSLIQKRGE